MGAPKKNEKKATISIPKTALFGRFCGRYPPRLGCASLCIRATGKLKFYFVMFQNVGRLREENGRDKSTIDISLEI
jgi:hypothetical protein